MTIENLKQIVEAALLAAGKPLSLERLQELFEEHARPEREALCAGDVYALRPQPTSVRYAQRGCRPCTPPGRRTSRTHPFLQPDYQQETMMARATRAKSAFDKIVPFNFAQL